MTARNVGFSSANIRALSGVYTDSYDGAVLNCFMFLFLCAIVLIVFLCMYVCYVL